MPHTLSQILPSLESLGIWSYWIIGLGSMLEAFFVTGIFVPGTLMVDAGGILVQQGVLDFWDLVWFVAIGSVLGGEISYWAGILARRGMNTRWNPESSENYQRAVRLFDRYGGLALVLGRFAGPVSGFVPFAAAVSGMDRRRFFWWNVAAGFPYAIGHLLLGYLLGGILARIGPLTTRTALLAAAVLLTLVGLWWLIVRIERRLPFAAAVVRSIAQTIAANPRVRAWAARHPALAAFIAHRLDASRASGLTATLLGMAILYVLIIWLGSVFDLLTGAPIVQVDARLANLIHAFWSPLPLKLAAHISALADWRVVASLLVAALAALWVRRRPDLMLGLVVSVAGNVVTVAILKRIFHRPRPELAYFVETSGSFPSGSAAISIAFHAMLFFIAWRLGFLGPIMAALLAATLAFLIGASDLYLIEHYLTDVLNGWLVGALWFLIGIALAEWWRERRGSGAAPLAGAMRIAGLGLAAALALFAGWQVITYEQARAVVVAQPANETVTDIATLFTSGTVPDVIESITGTPLAPANVVILARDETALRAAMAKAGWSEAQKPTLGTLLRVGWAMVTGRAESIAPVTPYFWDGQPDDLAFEKPAAENNSKRHVVRFWRTTFVTRQGLRLFVGAASLEDRLYQPNRLLVAPHVDPERDALVSELQKAGMVAAERMVQLPQPRLGTSVGGVAWITDGKAAIVTLK